VKLGFGVVAGAGGHDGDAHIIRAAETAAAEVFARVMAEAA
jgi:hypothetical protein